MTETTTQTGFSQETFESFLESRQEPEWLTDFRRESWNTFCSLDWPSRRHEEWLRTDIRLFQLSNFSPPTVAPVSEESPQTLLSENVDLGGQVVASDSMAVSSRLDPSWAAKGVVFGSLDELAGQHSELVQRNLMSRAVQPGQDRFAALHAAFWSGGTFLHVPRRVVVDQPLHSLSLMSDGGIDLGHTLLILEEGAEATLLSESFGPDSDASGLHCGATELILHPGSHLRYVQLQDWGHGVWHFAHQHGLVDRDASLQWTLGALGGRVAKVNQHVSMVGEGANCQVNGVLFTEGKQHISYHTKQHHQAPHCTSDFLYKAALQDRSRTVWRGMIKVDPGAQKTDGYQRNDNLLLTPNARADSIPGLEIEADDVRCTHGSTSGRVDEELVFYAMCRGLTRNEAVRMVVTGFFQQIFDRITIPSVREALGSAIARRVRDYD